jgi:outer membrane protein assembly factor BamB
MYCLDAKSGKEIWSYKTPSVIWSSPAIVDGKVIFGCSDPHIYMLDAETGKFIWKGEMGGRTLSTPIVVGGKIYVGSSTGAFKCFG